MRRLIAALCLTATPVLADDTTTSGMIAEQGLAATQAHLTELPSSPDRDMALGAVTFLTGIETAYQTRWRSGAGNYPIPLPLLGTQLMPNPQPEELPADFFYTLAESIAASMQSARDALPEDGGDGALVLSLGDLWFDIDGNGERTQDEDLMELFWEFRMSPQEEPSIEIRFDSADVHWLRAYTHLIEASTTLVRAFDPTEPMTQMQELRAAVAEQKAEYPPDPDEMGYSSYFGDVTIYADTFAIFIQTLRQQPDPALITETEQHVRDMIAANREFWTAVGAETDNDREWIPNDNQQAALAINIPPGSGAAWLEVLADAERVLDGELLVPYWRFASGYGLNVRAWLDDPQPIDMVGWFQGTEALPYAVSGEVMNGDSWAQFTNITQGRAGLYMVLFN